MEPDDPLAVNASQSTGLGVTMLLLTLCASCLHFFVEFAESSLSHVSSRSIGALCVCLLIVSIPITHSLGKNRYMDYSFWQPFAGGARFIILQFLGWGIWVCTIVIALYAFYFGTTQVYKGLIALLGVSGLVAEVFLLVSIQFFETKLISGQKRVQPSASPVSWIGVGNIGLALSLLSFTLAVVIDSVALSDMHSLSMGSVAMSAILIAVPFTHGLAGKYKDSGFAFYQPFMGGGTFVLLQALGWTVWGFTVAAAIAALYFGSSTSAGLITTAGVGGVVSQCLVLLSLKYFDKTLASSLCQRIALKDKEEGRKVPRRFRSLDPRSLFDLPAGELRKMASELWLDTQSFLLVFAMFMIPAICVVFNLTAPLFIAYNFQYGWVVVVSVFALYSLTYRNSPHHTGAWSWNAIRYNVWIWKCFERYFKASLVAIGKLEPKKTYIFGFHPHGILPVTAFWATRGPNWTNNYPNIDVDVLGASLMFWFPVMREMILWAGGRDVSRRSFVHALESKPPRSIMLVPGGQREMGYSTPNKESMIIVTRHKGFIKLALQYQVDLVPVLSFGEDQLMSNVQIPKMQNATRRWLGFGFPLYPLGRWYSPIPVNTPITIVVGSPISVAGILPTNANDEVLSRCVDKLHEDYYAALRKLFEEHKVAAGFPDCVLTYLSH